MRPDPARLRNRRRRRPAARRGSAGAAGGAVTGLDQTVLIVVGVAALLLLALLVTTANRLDRLHIRTDAAWAALDAALARRAVVARAVASTLADAEELRAAAYAAESAPRREREAAENRLTRLL